MKVLDEIDTFIAQDCRMAVADVVSAMDVPREKENSMSEAEIMRRLDRMECRLPPPLCDKVGHEKHVVSNDGLPFYACKHCGKDEMEFENESKPTEQVSDGICINDPEVIICGDAVGVLKLICRMASTYVAKGYDDHDNQANPAILAFIDTIEEGLK